MSTSFYSPSSQPNQFLSINLTGIEHGPLTRPPKARLSTLNLPVVTLARNREYIEPGAESVDEILDSESAPSPSDTANHNAASSAKPTDALRSDEETSRLIREMVTTHQPNIYRFVMKRIGHHDDANDIAQHTIAEAARTIDNFRGESQFSTWLFGIAMNTVRNYLNRSPQKLYKFDTDEALVELESKEINPCAQLEQKQILKAVSEAIDSLPEEMRRVLLMVTVEQTSYEETAATLSIPLGTVRSRISRARAMLRAQLEKDDIELPF